jgi:tripartite-type tricarboxylate transporter receptor subunit TctC
LVAPAGVPAEVVERLNREVVRVLGLPEVKRVLVEQGYEPVGSSAAEFTRFTAIEIAKWTKVTTAAGLRTK